MSERALSNLTYGLVLLQEINQGYDNSLYRLRAVDYLLQANLPGLGGALMLWQGHALATSTLIDLIENGIKCITQETDS